MGPLNPFAPFQSEPEFKTLALTLDAPVATLTLRPRERRNAIRLATMEELDQAVTLLEARSDLRCLILTGEGDEAFVSGGDLDELKALRTHEHALQMSRRMGGILHRLERLDMAVLVAINGIAVGGGCELALVGDQRFMAQEARLLFRQAVLGLTPGWGGLTRLSSLVGRSRAFHILLRESTLGPERALALGIVDEVVPRAELLSRVNAVAAELCGLPPLALKAVKRGLLRLPELPREQALDYEAELFARTWSSHDHWEALDAFFGRRLPHFRGE